MKRTSFNFKIIGIIIFLINNSVVLTGQSQNPTLTAYEGYYLTLNKYPVDDTPIWMSYVDEVQGVTHDDAYWYITVTSPQATLVPGYEHKNCWLWKVPVSEDLINISVSDLHVNLWQFPTIATADTENGYIHWGDPDHYNYNGIDYIIVPVTSPNPPNELPSPAVLFFKGSDLSLLGFAKLPAQGDVGWCAITHSPEGNLITSPDNTYYLYRYRIDWDIVAASGYHGQDLQYLGYHILVDKSGTPYSPSNFLHNMQGGEFTPTGELLYISNGSGWCDGVGDGQFETDGIHVFNVANWHEVQTSYNDETAGPTHYFNYHYVLGCDGACLDAGSWSPEGLTIWDLDEVSGHDSHVSGQLHVMLFHYQELGCDNEVTFTHFGGKVYVDGISGYLPSWPPNWNDPFTGTSSHPFRTFNFAYFWYPIWDGAEIIINAGSYPEFGIYKTRVKVNSQGGSAIIGVIK